MITNVSGWGVLLAALAAMIIGAIWYSKPLFGKKWMKEMKQSEAEMTKRRNSALASLILISLVTSYILAIFMYFYHLHVGGNWFKDGLYVSVLAWIGFAVTTILAYGVFDSRDDSVQIINAGNRLVTLVAMAMIIAAFMRLAT